MMPKRPEDMRKVDRGLLAREDEGGEPETPDTPAGKLERFWPLNLILAGAIFTYFISSIAAGTFTFDFNAVIALFLAVGLILHWTPIRTCGRSPAARGHRPHRLQYPLYGGYRAS
jgi:short subunit fatty acids transporter